MLIVFLSLEVFLNILIMITVLYKNVVILSFNLLNFEIGLDIQANNAIYFL